MQRHWNDHELETYWSFSSDELTLLPPEMPAVALGSRPHSSFSSSKATFLLLAETFLQWPSTTWRNSSMSSPPSSRITIGRAALGSGTGTLENGTGYVPRLTTTSRP